MIAVDDRRDCCVAVVVPSGALARYVYFEMSLEGLFVPKDNDLMRTMSGNPARGKNGAVRDALSNPVPWFTHFFFIDDDHAFDPDSLFRLLNRRLEIVCALTNWKTPPFTPLLFSGVNVDGDGRKKVLTYPMSSLDGLTGCHPVFAAAGSGLLVERQVFEALPDPWFRVGTYSPEELSEDLYFYEQARDAGFNIWVDLDVSIAHCAVVATRLARGEDGVWKYEIMWENKKVMHVGREKR